MMTNACDSIKSYIFFDCESTGLPFVDYNVRIIEISFTAVLAEHLLNHDKSQANPRVLNKLRLCFCPQKQINFEASNINGLDNYLLQSCESFSSNTVRMINAFIDSVPNPVCLVAHNGLRFDFPLLLKEMHKAGGDLDDAILCADSLYIFKRANELQIARLEEKEIREDLLDDTWDSLLCEKLDELDANPAEVERILKIQKANETTPSKRTSKSKRSQTNDVESLYYIPSKNASRSKHLDFGRGRQKLSFKLGDVYTRLTGKTMSNAHESEADVLMLLESAIALGDDFHQIAVEIATKISSIKPMR